MKRLAGLALACLLVGLEVPASSDPAGQGLPTASPTAFPAPLPVQPSPAPAETPAPAVPEVAPAPPPPAPKTRPPVPYKVTLLRSVPTLKLGGWRADWELRGARQALQAMGLPVAVIDPLSLRRKGCPTQILVLANCKNMDKATVLAVKEHIRRGGKVLATYQTSYKQEDNRSWSPNNFALSTELGIRFSRWVGGTPECARLIPTSILPGKPTGVALLRHQAMLVDPLPGSRVLATWDKTDKAARAAVVETAAGIYCGEDLLAPENAQSPAILQLLATYLGELDPQIHPVVPTPDKIKLPAPQPPVGELPPMEGEPTVRVGLGNFELAGGQLRLQAHRGPLRVNMGHTTRLCRQVTMRTEGGKFTVEALLESKPPLNTMEIVPTAPLFIYPTVKTTYVDAFVDSRDGTSRWEAYRGQLEAAARPAPQAAFSLINLLPLDAYLAGVVPSEVPNTFPAEALKAMAVVARTFCLSHLERHKAEGFDVCSEVHCQVYRGLASESEPTNRAIAQTLGQVLTYAGKPVDASFHACCGGYGVDVDATWPHPAVAYLKGTPDFDQVLASDLGNERDLRKWLAAPGDAYCSSAGRFRWDEKMRWSDLEARLEASLPAIVGKDFKGLGALKDIRVSVRDVSGRVAKLVIEGEKGTYTVGGDATRWITSGGKIGTGGLNSSLFVIDLEGAGADRVVHFRGGGWGHGVGLCQEGAAGRASAGQGYTEILAHYYRGAELGKDLASLRQASAKEEAPLSPKAGGKTARTPQK